jgi:arylesterase/paraoxonase
MRWSWRVAAIAGAVVAVGALALTVRTLTIAGVFTTVTPHFAGACKDIPGVTGAEDIAADRRDGLVFISASDRRPGHPARSRDGLYTLALAHPELGVTRLSGTPKDFHPLGIALYRAQNGSLTLMAVNIRAHGQPSVDIFNVIITKAADGSTSATLSERTSIRSSVIVHPNDVVATGPNRFYVTNDHLSHSAHGNFFETVLALPLGNIVYYNGAYPRVAAKALRFANGLALSADGTKLYVAETLGRDIRTYDVQPVTGKLTDAGDISLPAAPDNISRDAEGQLWVGAHPKLLAFLAYAKDPKKPSPSEIFRVATVNGKPESATLIYAGSGKRIGASSVGVYAGGHLFIGTVFDDKILACTLH